MKSSRIAGVSPEKVGAMLKSPEMAARVELCKRLMDGTASPEEKEGFEKRTARKKALPPGTLTESLIQEE